MLHVRSYSSTRINGLYSTTAFHSVLGSIYFFNMCDMGILRGVHILRTKYVQWRKGLGSYKKFTKGQNIPTMHKENH